jgi:hypothetical protein
MDRRIRRNGGGHGDAAMLRNLGSNGLYDERMIDDRNARPLTIAFATIVMIWMLAFGIVSVSAQFDARSHHMADSAGSIASSIEK